MRTERQSVETARTGGRGKPQTKAGGTYKECMQHQLADIEALIAKIKNIEV